MYINTTTKIWIYKRLCKSGAFVIFVLCSIFFNSEVREAALNLYFTPEIDMYIYHNCSSSCQEKQQIFQDGNLCYHFPVFLTENVSHKLILFNCVVNTLLMLTTIIGNILVLSAIWKTSSLRTPSIILLCGLATTDLVVGLVVQPLFLSMASPEIWDI